MEREACVCDHGYERSDLCAEINSCCLIVLAAGGCRGEYISKKCIMRIHCCIIVVLYVVLQYYRIINACLLSLYYVISYF